MNWSLIIGIAVQALVWIVVFSYGYGKLNQRIASVEETKRSCNERFRKIENEHSSTIQDIREEIKSISSSLNQLIGKIDVFFKMYEGR